MNYSELRGYAQTSGWAAKMLADVNEKNKAILAERQKYLDNRQGIGVGDFILDGDKVLRATHDWGNAMQTTCRHHDLSGDQSFYLGNGYVSFSGSLDPAIDKARFQATEERREGSVWFFSEDSAMAHNGYHTKALFRVWRLTDTPTQ